MFSKPSLCICRWSAVAAPKTQIPFGLCWEVLYDENSVIHRLKNLMLKLNLMLLLHHGYISHQCFYMWGQIEITVKLTGKTRKKLEQFLKLLVVNSWDPIIEIIKMRPVGRIQHMTGFQNNNVCVTSNVNLISFICPDKVEDPVL